MRVTVTANSCEKCNRRDLSLRWIEYDIPKGIPFLIMTGFSQVHTVRCSRHRLLAGLGYAARSLALTRIWECIPVFFNNAKGGKVIPGQTAELMNQYAAELTAEGRSEEAAKARSIATKYERDLEQELANLERSRRVEEQQRRF